ncbi:MAG: ABC transporter substrate-binding protein [Clostridiales bacterium]|nr:ABC transporter substrate-binding protein [Clostridiales bacterium]
MRKIGAIILVIALCVAAISGCSGNKEDGRSDSSIGDKKEVKDEVIIAIQSEPENGFDPTTGWGHGTTPLIQSTLVEYTQDMSIVNDLATNYTISEDGTKWVFTIRDDAYYTDGEPVKASDVAFTFNTAKISQSSLDLTYLVSCEVTGDYEATFTLNAPNSTFINTIATTGIVPEHAYSDKYANDPIGSGPWKFVQWNKGEQVILEANEDYYGNVPAIKKAVLVFMDEDAAFAAARAGQVDVALTSATHATQDIDGMRIEAVTTLDNRGFTLPIIPAGATSESGYPAGNDVTSNLAIRKAIAYCIDREQIARDALNGFATPAYSENDGMPWNNPDVKIEADIEKAKKFLAEDGWEDVDGDGIVEKNGLKAEFKCIYPSGDSVRQAIAMAAAEQVKEIGINIVVEGLSWDEISKRMFSDAVLMGWGSSNPYTSYLLFHSKNKLRDDYYNPEGFNNATVDGYLDAALHAGTSEEAYDNWKLAQWDGTTGTSMRGECPWVWLVNIQHIYYVADGLDIGDQQLHEHGASWTLVQNLRDWRWK